MKKLILLCCVLLVSGRTVFAQFGGSAGGFGGAGAAMGGGGFGGSSVTRDTSVLSPLQNELSKRRDNSSQAGTREDPAAMFIEASVLMNVKADEYVAVFAVSHQEKTAGEADAKMNATISAFKQALRKMSVKEADIFVDFVLQNRVYTFTIETEPAPGKPGRVKEELVGFDLKKNVSIRFQDKELLDQIASAGAKLGIYDLVKVDYVVKNIAAVQAQLQAETARVLKAKIERYNQFGVQSLTAVQIISDIPSIYYPLVNYRSYQAAETNSVTVDSDRYSTERALKTNTYYFNPLDGSGFDTVINPVIIEPVVQFTSYVKVRARRLS